jgi:hypothetical protein
VEDAKSVLRALNTKDTKGTKGNHKSFSFVFNRFYNEFIGRELLFQLDGKQP